MEMPYTRSMKIVRNAEKENVVRGENKEKKKHADVMKKKMK